MLEAEIVGSGVRAATGGGDVGLFGKLIDGIDRGIQSAIIAASTAGQLHVELEKLAAFYNALSALHEEHLLPRMTALHAKAVSTHDTMAGGHVPGVQKAWKAIAESAGVAKHRNSLYGNLQAVDNLVLQHMASMLETAQQYAAQENQAIAGFGKVSTAAAAASKPAASTGW